MATGITQAGPAGASPVKATLASNYIDFTSGADATGINDWRQQYLPELMEKEAEIFGNRTVGGFLEMVGAEEPATSDAIVWSEQERLHLKYSGLIHTAQTDAHGVMGTDNAIIDGLGTNSIRVNDTVLVSSAAKNKTVPCLVIAVNGDTANAVSGFSTGCGSGEIAVIPIGHTGSYKAALGHANTEGDNDPLVVTVYGSMNAKGTTGRTQALEPGFTSRSNNMMIMKDLYEVNGSDAAQIGWVEVAGEDGQAGYYWFLKAAGDTRQRFADYCEMSMVESVKATNATLTGANLNGSEGLFQAVDTRGIVSADLDDTSQTGTAMVAEFDDILKEFDKQGAIEEYMMFLNRATSLFVDDMLAAQNAYGSGGTSYGVFENSEDMALNLGFSGFRRGSYDFYKTDWKYLNDIQTRGALTGDGTHVRGLFIPAGVSSVYDQALGRNLKRPFLHVRYRASEMDDRRFKTWTTGSVGAATSDLDAMQMHFLTERCLVVQGANNFCILRD